MNNSQQSYNEMQTNMLYNVDLCKTYIFHIIFMMEDEVKQCLRKKIVVTWREEKPPSLINFCTSQSQPYPG